MPFDLSNFELLLPRAIDWVRAQETFILERGVPLDTWEQHIAQQLGIAQPDKVRLLQVEQVPLPADADLCSAAAAAGLVAANSIGMGLRYGIFIRDDFWRDRATIAHELVHTAQCERLGWELFLRQYLSECLQIGYPQAPMEQEAREFCKRITSEQGLNL